MPNAALLADDRLLVMGRQERVEQLLAWGAVLDGRDHDSDMLRRRFADLNLIEAIIPPRSAAIGKTLVDLDLRSQYKVTTIAIWRGGRSWRTDVGKFQLQVGDAMLVIGLPDNVARLAQSRDYMVPASGYPTRRLKRERGPLAVLITAVVLALAIGGVVSLPEVMLAGAVAMVLSGCLSMDSVYQAIEWRVIFLVAGMLPLSLAMAETGLAERVGSLMVDALAGANPLILVGSMFLVTTGITQIIGGQVTGLVIGPIAITAALQIGVDPRAMAVAVAIGCSTAFLTPIAHPVNMLMMGPGNYTFNDFLRVGAGMTLVTLVTLLAGMALFWGVG
jgi:di/tricarboxylate transporter